MRVDRLLTLQADCVFGPLYRNHDAERDVGHSVARDPVGDSPALIRAEFPVRARVTEELADAYPPVGTCPRVPVNQDCSCPGPMSSSAVAVPPFSGGTASGNAGSAPSACFLRGYGFMLSAQMHATSQVQRGVSPRHLPVWAAALGLGMSLAANPPVWQRFAFTCGSFAPCITISATFINGLSPYT
jgi:hypothetical protein